MSAVNGGPHPLRSTIGRNGIGSKRSVASASRAASGRVREVGDSSTSASSHIQALVVRAPPESPEPRFVVD